jgi:hypothetical protein
MKPFYKNFKDYSLFDAISGDLSIKDNNYNWLGFKVLNMEIVETKKEKLERIEKEKIELERIKKIERDRIEKIEKIRLEKIEKEKIELERIENEAKLLENIRKNINDFKNNNLIIISKKDEIVKIRYNSLYNNYTEILNYYNQELSKLIDSNGYFYRNADPNKIDLFTRKRNKLSLKIIELYSLPYKSVSELISNLKNASSIEEKEKLLNILEN